jgi:hypothetical protein
LEGKLAILRPFSNVFVHIEKISEKSILEIHVFDK